MCDKARTADGKRPTSTMLPFAKQRKPTLEVISVEDQAKLGDPVVSAPGTGMAPAEVSAGALQCEVCGSVDPVEHQKMHRHQCGQIHAASGEGSRLAREQAQLVPEEALGGVAAGTGLPDF